METTTGDDKNRAERPESQDGRDKPRASTSELQVDSIRAEVSAEILESPLLCSLVEEIQKYFANIHLNGSMEGIDIKRIFSEIIEEITGGDEEKINFEIEGLSVYLHPKFNEIFTRVAQICTQKITKSLGEGNLFISLQYLILANECARIAKSTISQEILNQFLFISALTPNIPDGPLKDLFSRAKELFPDEFPDQYKNFIALQDAQTQLQCIDKAYLERYISQAKKASDRQNCILFLKEIARREPSNVHFLMELAVALEDNGGLNELKEAIEIRKNIAVKLKLTAVGHEKNRIAMNKLKEKAGITEKPIESQEDVAATSAEKKAAPEPEVKPAPLPALSFEVQKQQPGHWNLVYS